MPFMPQKKRPSETEEQNPNPAVIMPHSKQPAAVTCILLQ